MKAPPPPFLIALIFIAAVSLRAEDAPDLPLEGKPVPQSAMMVKYALLVPADKTLERVKAGERNPYGKNEDSNLATFKGTNEENIIRDQLVKLRASGVSFENEDTRVMLGDMILRPGQFVPPVLPHQTLTLRVAKIRRDSIELQWVEKKYTALPPRILTIPMDLRPIVHYKLQGQGGVANLTDAVRAKGMKMGEQVQSELVGGPTPTAESNTAGNSKIGAAWEVSEPTNKAVDIPSAAILPANGATSPPPLIPVNLDTVSRFIPKQPVSQKTDGGSGQPVDTNVK